MGVYFSIPERFRKYSIEILEQYRNVQVMHEQELSEAKTAYEPQPAPDFILPERERSALSGANSFGISRLISVPYYGEIAAGRPIEIITNPDLPSYPFPDDKLIGGAGNYFCVTARGTSMIAIGIEDGDLLLIRKTDGAEHNDIAVVRYQNDSTIKRLRLRDGAWFLCWEDGSGKCIEVDSEDYAVQGILAGVLKETDEKSD